MYSQMYSQTLPPDHGNEVIGRIKLGRTLLRQRKYAEAAVESQRGFGLVAKQPSLAVSELNSARRKRRSLPVAPDRID